MEQWGYRTLAKVLRFKYLGSTLHGERGDWQRGEDLSAGRMDLGGVTKMDNIRNMPIRRTAQEGRLRDKVREARLKWFVHVHRRDSGFMARRMLKMELPGRIQRERPKEIHGYADIYR